jgi:hypothetical protein|tara:strand:+ start:200 stop:394 length:195 start_codon:yes stop_codon:yes gene_type:complete
VKVGDLVKMKYSVWWRLRNHPEHLKYVEETGIVVECSETSVKVLLESGKFKSCLAEQWEVISAV